MEAKQHNVTPIMELMNDFYSPGQIARTIDDVMFYYAVKRLEEGNVCSEDAMTVAILKDLRDALNKCQ